MRQISCAALVLLAACGPTSSTGDGGTIDLKNPPPKSFRVTVSGENFASEGYAFPPTAGQEVSFKDGWEVKYTRVLTTVSGINFAANPDLSPTDQSKTGEVVATIDGAFAVDLVKGGGLGADGANAVAIAATNTLNKKGGGAFDSATRYAFGYQLVAASGAASQVNLDEAAKADYAQMVKDGVTTLLVGTATFKGTACRTTNPAFDFARLPKAVNFKFGFKSPVTYKNCLNPAIADDARGVQVKDNAAVDVQVTVHLDHPFWEALVEDAPLRFDALAARKSVASGAGPATAELTLADLAGVDLQSLKDAQGAALPWRYCGAMEAGERTTGALAYDPSTVPVNPAGGAQGLKDLADYMTWNQSTFGHLNFDGLCYPARDYPSPQ